MHKAVLLQLAATLLAATAALVLFGVRGFCSAMWGGLAYAVPSGLFVGRLWVASFRKERATVTAFVAGELLRLLSTAALLVLAAALYKDLHWGAFLIGLALAVKANLFAFLVKTRT
ncbi:MAG: ATP synthase subunit I [Azoarcus sp.]|jgi:ATP synthase protein I|nr:ATP synthase subunit I [Azoarcus sp.]